MIPIITNNDVNSTQLVQLNINIINPGVRFDTVNMNIPTYSDLCHTLKIKNNGPQVINIAYSDFSPTITEKNPGFYGSTVIKANKNASYSIIFTPNNNFPSLENGYFILVNHFKKETGKNTYVAKRAIVHIINVDVFSYPQNKSHPITI